ncbi:MarR family transcriptional regulator [Pseudonocardia sp. CA-107938]|uniref:MarR family transcriptional regulator n=1 Tax=Pseudonocardia sp. CA-107938 TaxID=3240021 RepID=UPI003D8BBE14
MSTADAVRSLLLLMPRIVGRVKRLPVPEQLRDLDLDLAPRHLSLFAQLQYDGPLTVGQLAERLEVAPTTVSLMVAELSRRGVLVRREDESDRRRRIVAIAPDLADAIAEWLGGSARAWTAALADLTDAERFVVVQAFRAFQDALGVTET